MTAAHKTVTVLHPATDHQGGTKKHEKTKMKADTDQTNEAFLETLRQRANQSPKNAFAENKELLKSLSIGRPPKERMNIPEGVEVFMYGNQKLNIWEFQKEQMRK